jgi:AraC-like DNA-binding protein
MRDDGDPELVRPTIPMRYLAEMTDPRRVPARAAKRALVAAALPSDAIRHPRLRTSVVRFERFFTALRREARDECFGVFARPVPPGSYAVLVRMLVGAVDVASCFDAVTRFYRLFDRHAYWSLEVGRARATLTLSLREPSQARSAFFVHSMLLSPWRTAEWLAGRPIALDAVRLPRALSSLVREAHYLFGREPDFVAGPPSLDFPSELARLPVTRTLGEVDVFVRSSLRHILTSPPNATLLDEVRSLLCASEPGAASLVRVARRLGTSRAALARRLAGHGTSFQQIKDDVRRDRAIELLSATSLTIAQIAERVGYSDASAFQRAFRGWTGSSPGRLRLR